MDQMSLFSETEEQLTNSRVYLPVVKAKFIAGEKKTWNELFEGYDELYAITYSSGLDFTVSVIDNFKYAEIIYGCEAILSDTVGVVLALEKSLIDSITKSNAAKKMSERIAEKTLALYVSRNTISHSKIFCLKAGDGRTRVIVGSANLSKSAFEGFQKENITYFDDREAYDWYYERYVEFREQCSDNVNEKVLVNSIDNKDYLMENPEDIPFIQTVKERKYVFLEPSSDDDIETEIVTSVKNMEHELKPMLPKMKKEKGKTIISAEHLAKVRSAIKGVNSQKKEKERHLPKLHIDYDKETLDFNGEPYNFTPEGKDIAKDLEGIEFFLNSLESFHGDYKRAQEDYFRFMNWVLSSIFMPYLRCIAYHNNYDITTLPVFGIMYGDSNGGKTTFIELLNKIMTGKKIPANPSSDFTTSALNDLKRGIEGVPINFDDLDKQQFANHSDKVIKEDEWGIIDRFYNYPGVIITTNKLPSLEAPILKRVVAVRIDIRIEKEEGLQYSRKLKESIANATTAFYSEYVKRMIPLVKCEADRMINAEENEYVDIFKISSRVIVDIFNEYLGEVPDYVKELSLSDYYGPEVTGRNAIRKIKDAWNSEPQSFRVDKQKNLLIYSFPDSAVYEIKYLIDELPARLNAKKNAHSLTMNLDEAEKFFNLKFKRGFLTRLKNNP